MATPRLPEAHRPDPIECKVHGPGERSYHVFYQMLAGVTAPAERAALGLKSDASEYAYLRPSASGPSVSSAADGASAAEARGEAAAEWAETEAKLAAIGLGAQLAAAVRRTLAAVLTLGQVWFSDPERRGSLCSGSPAGRRQG